MWCFCVGKCVGKTPLLILRSVGIFVLCFCRFVVELSVVLHLLVTVSGLAKVAIFTPNVDAENQCLINHKCVCGALNRHFCQTRVMRSAFYFFLIFDIVCPMDLVGLSISFIAKSIASFINAFTFVFL